MRQRSVLVLSVLAGLGLLVSGCASDGPMGSGGSSGGGPSGGQANALQTCLDRISGGSAGARMVAEETCRDNEALRVGIVGTATAKSNDRPAAGTAGDTLDGCMARIPKDASAGQRMLAEESCHRDQANRR